MMYVTYLRELQYIESTCAPPKVGMLVVVQVDPGICRVLTPFDHGSSLWCDSGVRCREREREREGRGMRRGEERGTEEEWPREVSCR